LKLYVAKYFTKKMWETISDLNVYVQVAKASVFFRRYTLRKILPKIGTGLILLAASVYRSMIPTLQYIIPLHVFPAHIELMYT
jgi:hypothetical protein